MRDPAYESYLLKKIVDFNIVASPYTYIFGTCDVILRIFHSVVSEKVKVRNNLKCTARISNRPLFKLDVVFSNICIFDTSFFFIE